MAKGSRGGKRTSTNRESRGQLDYQGRENAINQIMADTGTDLYGATDVYNSVSWYTGTGYRRVRDLSDNSDAVDKTRNNIETYISNAPTYDGEIYRGIKLGPEGQEFVSQLQKGATINMDGISSWSSDENVATRFSRGPSGLDYGVIFKLKNKSGVGIKHLSSLASESEVLQSSKSKFKIKNVTPHSILTNKFVVELEEI